MFIKSPFSSSFAPESNKEINFYFQVIDEALNQGFQSIKPENIVKQTIQRSNDILYINKNKIPILNKRLFIVGAGKATFDITKAIIPVLGKHYFSGIINIPKTYYNQSLDLPNTIIEKTSHPIPDMATFLSSQKQLNVLASLGEDDIVFVIISGGASSLFEVPVNTIPPEDIIELYNQLLISGLSIQKINTIRKQVSQIKGGKLLYKTKAQIIGILISDIPGDDLSSIGSGPTVTDQSTSQECLNILIEGDLYDKIPKSIINFLEQQTKIFPPLISSKSLNNVFQPINFLLASNTTILKSIHSYISSQNIESEVCSNDFSGDAQELGSFLYKYCEFPYIGIPKCLLFGGESTVQILDDKFKESSGGRNQELILSFICDFIENNSTCKILLVSIGTDGIDGNSTNAGAVFCSEAHKELLFPLPTLKSYLEHHNSSLSLPAECYISIGPTGTNVGDIIILLLY